MANVGKCLLCAAASVVLLAASSRADTKVWPTDYDPRYVQAVQAASQPLTQDDVVTNLTTIGSNDHIRNAANQILMTMFTNYQTSGGAIGYTRAYSSTAWHPKLWTTVAPQLQDFLTDNNVPGSSVSLRTKQLLGLPENNTGYYVVEFYANTSSLFRPAMDADITHSTTSLNFVGDMANPTDPKRIWFDKNMSTYDPSQTNPPIPWTRAGYTYDWGNPASDVGLSEFILNNTSSSDVLVVRSVIGITSYKYYVRATDSFNVTDWCDTIWMGSSYLPVTAGGNVVYVHDGVTISGGQGIVVTDLSSGLQSSDVTIINAGTIRGASSTGKSSMYFTNTGGTLYNSGTITGDDVGVLGENSTRPITIVNSGTIRGTSYAVKTSGGDDLISTSGLIDGRIFTGAGNDTVNVLGGAITGSIDGGTGTNTVNFNLANGSTFAFNSDILNMTSVDVNGGTALLNGQVSGDVAVAAGATLGGNAAIGGSLTNSGVVAPGDGIGQISVGGNYTQNAGGTLALELAKSANGALNANLLTVTGAATLKAGSTLELICNQQSEGVYALGDRFLLIGAAAMDNNAALSGGSAFLGFSESIVGGNLYATVTRPSSFAAAADAGNNRSMASALDADAAAGVTGAHARLINQLMFTDFAAFNDSLRLMSPSIYLAAADACDRTTQYMAESVGGYLRSRRAGQTNLVGSQTAADFDAQTDLAKAVGSPSELASVVKYCGGRTADREPVNSDPTRSVWVNPFGVFYGEQTAGDHLGFQSDVAGVQFGIDKQFDANFIAGVGAGYDQMHIDGGDLASAGTTNTFRAGPYATWYNDVFYLDGSLTGGFHSNQIGRQAAVNDETYTADGSYRANDVSLYLGGGRDYHVGAYTVSPLVSLQYIYFRQNAFTETGDDGAALAVDARDANSLRSRVGSTLRREYHWGNATVIPQLTGGWAHEYLDDDPLEAQFTGGVTPFSIDRGGVFRDAGFFDASLTVQRGQRASVFARYNGEYSSGGHFSAVDTGLAIRF
jgi:uncharacterized protein with beta-barrel porin domain